MPNQDPEKAIRRRLDFLAKRESALTGKVSSLERQLFALLSEKLFSQLDVEDGLIKSSQGNLKLSTAIDRIFKQFNRDIHSKVVRQFKDDLFATMDLHDGYFRQFGNADRIMNIRGRNRAIMSARLGVGDRGGLVSGGFLDNFLNDSSLKNEVVNATVSAISGKGSTSAFKNQLSTLIKGAPDSAGGRLQRHYRTFAYDTYAESDRTYSNLWATELKMTAFLYLGGQIATTRKFCCERNGLVFTIEEANKWKDLTFSGRPATGYKPLTQLGGHNCRHSTQWIDNDQALLLRRDLSIINGKLKSDPRKKKQKLNAGCKKKK